MILERLSLEQWRRFRAPQSFVFDQGVTLLVGPNEAGKSTLLEALARAFFDKHGSRSRAIRALRPIGGSGAPQVAVEFRHGGASYRLRKRYLSESFAELSRRRGGEWQLEHEGDAAERAVQALFRDPAASAAGAMSRGIAQALWYLQEDNDLPRGSWNDAVRKGLVGLARLAVGSAAEDELRASLESEYGKVFTPAGNVSARSEQAALRRELPALETTLEAARSSLERLRRYRQEAEGFDRRVAEERSRLEEAKRRRADLASQLAEREDELASLAAERAELQQRLEAARTLGERLTEVRRLEDQEASRRKELESLQGRREALEEEIAAARKSRKRRAKQRQKEVEAPLARLDEQLEERRLQERLMRLEAEERREREAEAERERLEQRAAEMRQALTAIVVPEPDDLAELVVLRQRIDALRSEAERLSVRLRFEDWSATAAPQFDSGEVRDVGDGVFELRGPTELEVPGVGRLRIEPAAGVLEELEQLDGRLRESLEALQAESVDELQRRREQRSGLHKELDLLQARRADLDAGEALRQRRLTWLKKERAAMGKAASQSLLPGVDEWTLGSMSRDLRALELERRELVARRGESQELDNEGQRREVKALEALRDCSERQSEVKAELRALRERQSALLESYDDAGAAEKELEKLEKEVSERRQRVDERRATGLEKLIEAAEVAEAEVTRVGGELHDLEAKIADRRARIEEIAGGGIVAEVETRAARLDFVRRRLEALEGRSRGLALLIEMLRAWDERTSRELVAPVLERVNDWWRRVSGGLYERVELDSGLLPTRLHAAGESESLPLGSLSTGATAQLVVLIRLAIALALSREERQLVVLDDRLVDADPDRLQRLLDIVREVSEHCQIVLATCDPGRYESLPARRVEVPPASGGGSAR